MEQTSSMERNKRFASPLESQGGVEECIGHCLECFQSCTQLVSYCLRLGGKHAEPGHISLLTACSLICETSAKFMMVESNFYRDTCRVCTEVCKACADDCEKMGGEDPIMKECADVCRECAESCMKMAAH